MACARGIRNALEVFNNTVSRSMPIMTGSCKGSWSAVALGRSSAMRSCLLGQGQLGLVGSLVSNSNNSTCVRHTQRFYSAPTDQKVPIELVKQLRQRIGVGVMECREALAANNLDVEQALKYLVKKGSGTALKQGRTSAEGAVYAVAKGNKGSIVELNSETDFVSRGTLFQSVATALPPIVLESSSAAPESSFVLEDIAPEKVNQLPLKVEGVDAEPTVAGTLSALRFQIGENILVRRAINLVASPNNVVSCYTHGNGRHAALVALSITSANPVSEDAKLTVHDFGYRVAIQTVAYLPEFLSSKQVTSQVLEEKGIPVDQKHKWMSEKVLLEQPFYFPAQTNTYGYAVTHNADAPVREALKDLAKAIQADRVNIVQYLRWSVGEGIEKKEQNFGAEVAAAAGKP